MTHRPRRDSGVLGADGADVPIDERFVKVLSHPLKRRLLGLLEDNVASPIELARQLGEPLGTVAYHVRTLAELDFIELVDTRTRRGAVEHYYRAREDDAQVIRSLVALLADASAGGLR